MKNTRIRPHLFSVATAIVALLAVASAGFAHEGHHHNVMGTVRAIQPTQLDLETTEGKLEAFVVSAATTYKRGDAAAKAEDVKLGERAVVMYEKKGGKNIAIEIKLPAGNDKAGGEGSEPGSTASRELATPVGSGLVGEDSLRRVESRFVCMVNNTLFDRPQIPVEVEGRTYFGCCPMCKERLATDAAARESVDPVSGRKVDKATAVIGVLPSGAVVYFETERNLITYRANLAGSSS